MAPSLPQCMNIILSCHSALRPFHNRQQEINEKVRHFRLLPWTEKDLVIGVYVVAFLSLYSILAVLAFAKSFRFRAHNSTWHTR